MEYAAGELGFTAAHQETAPDAGDPLIVKLTCSLVGAKAHIMAPKDGWYARQVGAAETVEEFNCNYGLSSQFETRFQGSKLEFVARDREGQVRAFRLTDHPFFLGTLFQPELCAHSGALHPLVEAFLRLV